MNFTKVLLVIGFLAVLAFAVWKIAQGETEQAQPANTEIRTLLPEQAQAGKVFVCYYNIYTLEERTDSTAIKLANFGTVWDVDTRTVPRKKPFYTALPGKGQFPKEKLLRIIPPEEGNDKVTYILDVDRIDSTCKIYDFTQAPR